MKFPILFKLTYTSYRLVLVVNLLCIFIDGEPSKKAKTDAVAPALAVPMGAPMMPGVPMMPYAPGYPMPGFPPVPVMPMQPGMPMPGIYDIKQI